MDKIKLEIMEILNVVFEEKDNFKYENNYLEICNKLKKIMPIIEEIDEAQNTYYKQMIKYKYEYDYHVKTIQLLSALRGIKVYPKLRE